MLSDPNYNFFKMYMQQVRLHGQVELQFKYRNFGTFYYKGIVPGSYLKK